MKSVSTLQDYYRRLPLVWCFIVVFFLYNENTNYWIWIKQYYYSNQPCNKLQNLCSLDATATSTTIVSFFLVLKVSLLLD